MGLRFIALLALGYAVGCAQPAADDKTNDPASPSQGEDEAVAELLDPVGLLVRASLDLRGVRPTIDELEAALTDPASVDATVASFLHDERFGARVREMFADIYVTRQDYYYVTAEDFGLTDEIGFVRSVGDEPLRILSTIVEEDLPYTEIVTADWTMANELLGAAFPVDYPEDGTGWMKVHYTDTRPAAGILSTNGMWWRYMSNTSNANRGRANAISKILTCHDYLAKPIEFDRNVNLLDGDALNDALQNNPGCVACHNTLDPLASYLFGFDYLYYDSALELKSYHPEREHDWADLTGVAPGYYGEPGTTLDDLGWQMAADPRLPECITQQVFERLLQREVDLDDTEALTMHRQVLLDADLVLRPLFASVLASDEYRNRIDADGNDVRKLVSATQFAEQIEALTGFSFTNYGYDLMASDTYGVRTLAGGVDGLFATKAADRPTTTMALVHERYAQAAADHVVNQERNDPDNAVLFTEISFNETPQTDRDAMVAQVQRLHLAVLGRVVAPDGPEVEANLGLWEDLHAVTDRESAWTGVLSVLMRDPDFLFY